jgi:gas vesicle protein
MDDQYQAVSAFLIRPEDGKRARSGHQKRNAVKPREKDPIKKLEKEGRRLGVIFNGMQGRINGQLPVALFTDIKTESTFGVEQGESVKAKLSETRESFRSVQNQF